MAKNSSKGKEKTLQEKFKQFFGIKEPCPINFDHLKTEPHVIDPEILVDIGPETVLSQRLKAISELNEIVLTKPLQDNAVEFLCNRTGDLLNSQCPIEARHTVLQFYCHIVKGQFEKMDVMRNYFFKLIKNHTIHEDAYLRLELLKALSNDGKSIIHFEEDIGPFLLGWYSDIIKLVKPSDFLSVLVNIIKFNAAYIDEDVITGFIKYTSSLCQISNNEEDIQMCLDLMNAVLCYSHLPFKVLEPFIFTLCNAVNIEKFSQNSWKVMRNLLGTSMGHTSIFTLCVFLEDKEHQKVRSVLRGAVFFIGMALWGSNKVPSLMHPPSAVLPSFLKALDCNDSVVAYEIILSVKRLIEKNGQQMQTYTWEIILDIIERVLQYQELQESSQPLSVLATSVHELLTAIEESSILACSNRLYDIIERCSDNRDENSVIRLIMHKVQFIQPTREDFLANLDHLLEVFFKNETRQAVQSQVLSVVQCMYSSRGYLVEDDLMEQTVLQYLLHLDTIPNAEVRKVAVELLVEIAETCTTKRFFDVIDILDKMLKRPFIILPDENFAESNYSGYDIFFDVEAAVLGLISIFKQKMHILPSSHCVRIFDMLVGHIQSHYQKLTYYEESVKIRKMIIEFFLQMRSNAQKQIGVYTDNGTKYSVYVLCNSRDATTESNLSPSSGSNFVISSFSMAYINYEDAFQVLITCLKQEKHWSVLNLMFQDLPNLLQNKALIISANCNLNTLCTSLCALLRPNDTASFSEMLYNPPIPFTRTDFQALIYPVIASLPAYHSELETYKQNMIIRSLQSGLVSRSAKQCIEGLILCCLEMRNMMVKLLPAVLLKLSKISATVSVSGAVLEFLSNLIRLPELYVSFVEDQYMSIFAIALPYTNPFKFKQFTVALAHHVIAMWFLKCRIPFRKEFAKFITKGLWSNISVPFEENQSRSTQSINTDEVASKNGTGDNNRLDANQNIDESIITLHTELMETGIDLMARFTFGMSSNVPERSSIADFLLEKGQKSSWIVGNKIITITTSGCGTKAFKFGLCEKCYASCRDLCNSMESDENEPPAFEPVLEPVRETIPSRRRRHQSAFHRSSPETSQYNSSYTKDDIVLHRQHSELLVNYNRRNTSYVPKESSHPILPDEPSSNDKKEGKEKNLCSCWCSGWAEIHIRRPTGNTSWMMKIQNHLFLPTSPPDIPLPAITSLILPHKDESTTDSSLELEKHELCASETDESSASEQVFQQSVEETPPTRQTSDAVKCPKPDVSLRRTNSSPDMNTGWAGLDNSKEHLKQFTDSDEVENSPTLENKESTLNLEDSVDYNSSKEPCLKSNDESQPVKSNPIGFTSELKEHTKVELHLNIAPSPHSTQLDHATSACITEKSSPSPFTFRDRGHTISVMSPAHRDISDTATRSTSRDMHRSGMNPSFVFLQLYHNSCFGTTTEKPLLLHQTEANNRALKVLDHIQPYDTHKIGVVYVGPGQANDELAILSNVYGSLRYVKFLRGLGNMVCLKDINQESTYVGGLDIRGDDGKFALVWHDDVMQVIFHVATLMPNRKTDSNKTEKKKHIANDFVTIVYNESGEDYNLSTIKGQVTSACVIVQPDDFKSNVVTVKMKTNELTETFGHTEAYIVSDESLPIFVRQMALHANLACLILTPRQQSAQYLHVSNWLERLRTIKRLRKKVLDDLKMKQENQELDYKPSAIVFTDDFTDYV